RSRKLRSRSMGAGPARRGESASEDIPAQILVFYDVPEPLAHVLNIHTDRLFLQLHASKGDLFQERLHDRVEPARADVLGILIHHASKPCQFPDSIFGETEPDSLSFQKRGVLLDQSVPGLRKNPDKFVLTQGSHLHANWEA